MDDRMYQDYLHSMKTGGLDATLWTLFEELSSLPAPEKPSSQQMQHLRAAWLERQNELQRFHPPPWLNRLSHMFRRENVSGLPRGRLSARQQGHCD